MDPSADHLRGLRRDLRHHPHRYAVALSEQLRLYPKSQPAAQGLIARTRPTMQLSLLLSNIRRMPAEPTVRITTGARSVALRCIAAMKASVHSAARSPGGCGVIAVPARTQSVRLDHRDQRCAVCNSAGRALSGDTAQKWRAATGVFRKNVSFFGQQADSYERVQQHFCGTRVGSRICRNSCKRLSAGQTGKSAVRLLTCMSHKPG